MKRRWMTVAVCATLALSLNTAKAQAVVGAPAPNFSAVDTSGKPVALQDFKGKFVVIEWTSTSCPFVGKHYDSGNMQATQRDAMAKGAVWLSIETTALNWRLESSATELRAWQKSKNASPTATIVDGGGKIASSYRAKATPHMFVVDPNGTLIYAGAIDDKPSTHLADVKTATNYVALALGEAMNNKPVSHPSTQAYGCSVKYF